MCYRGRVQNGVVVLENGAELAEGTIVQVEAVVKSSVPGGDESIPTLYEQLEPLVGSVEGLPPDMAKNHDHYLHGHPKR